MDPIVHQPDNAEPVQPTPQPVQPPQPAYQPPTPPSPVMGQPAVATAISGSYHSNPFTASLAQLSVVLKANPVSILTLGLLMIAFIFITAVGSGLIAAIIPGVIAKVVL